MSIPKDIVRDEKGLTDWCILSCYRGSIAHGMYVPNTDPNSIDDKDAMAICVPPEDFYIGLYQYGSRGTKEIKRDEFDIVIYEVKKFISLLEKGNPNVLCALWLDPTHYIGMTDAGRLLIENRNLFVGKHVFHSFSGYAHGQLHRITHFKFEGYMGEKRKRLVDKYGFDTKNAAHLIRLLRMGIEFLNDGVLYVKRHDAQQLLEIKRGEWPLHKIREEADRLFRLCEEAYLKSSLPVSPNGNLINELAKAVIKSAWGWKC